MATANDRAVLRSLLHPNAPFGDLSPEPEPEPRASREEQGGAFAPELLEQARQLEIQGVAAAEAGDLPGALESFGRAIQLLPGRASAYNNRAQALRLQGEVAGALEDLEVVLRLSQGGGHVACQAFVQRGLIRRLRGQDEEARRDFEQAARLGSSFARRQLVLLNPYAALCNQMLAEVMKTLRGPAEGPRPRGEEPR
ncbi:tetratricopeptide repeat protein 36 [Elgaria multicarinata webbii]|uniref:tetratricopeptide repeat protein 36 n=1 Tax=Elgaria multicarinata webbii TaxID=159646 RepID=UPI002FCCC1F5